MFTYLRYFSAISFVMVVAAAILVGIYFRHTAADDLKMVVEQNNISLEQGFQNTVWRRYRRLFTEILANTDVKQWPQDKYFVQFSREAFRYFEGIHVAKINIYTANGERFLSTDPSEIMLFQTDNSFLFGKSDSSGNEALEAVKNGKIFSRIIPEGGFKGADGNMRRGSLVQTYVPIMSDSYVPVVTDNSTPKIEGYMEVFFDITPQYRQLDQFQMVGTSGIIIIFIVLFAALIFTARRAETIIAKQHDKTLELTAAKARAEAENMEKSRFLANISHELRTPLNAIIGFSEIVKTQSLGPINNSQYVEYVADIHSSGVHLLSLINDILDYSKAEAGKLELEISELDATKLVRSCLRLVQTRADEAKVKLVDNVPKEHFILNTDAKKLKQILLNLLSNAVKFTPENGAVTVSAWYNVMEETYSIEVKDTGIGIAPKDISKAMSPFGQVDSELSRKYEGTGLGLPLTKKFTEVMGGVFSIQSEINVGTSITVTLPKFPPANAIKRGSNTSTASDSGADSAAKTSAPKPAIQEETKEKPTKEIVHKIEPVPLSVAAPASKPVMSPTPAAAPVIKPLPEVTLTPPPSMFNKPAPVKESSVPPSPAFTAPPSPAPTAQAFASVPPSPAFTPQSVTAVTPPMAPKPVAAAPNPFGSAPSPAAISPAPPPPVAPAFPPPPMAPKPVAAAPNPFGSAPSPAAISPAPPPMAPAFPPPPMAPKPVAAAPNPFGSAPSPAAISPAPPPMAPAFPPPPMAPKPVAAAPNPFGSAPSPAAISPAPPPPVATLPAPPPAAPNPFSSNTPTLPPAPAVPSLQPVYQTAAPNPFQPPKPAAQSEPKAELSLAPQPTVGQNQPSFGQQSKDEQS